MAKKSLYNRLLEYKENNVPNKVLNNIGVEVSAMTSKEIPDYEPYKDSYTREEWEEYWNDPAKFCAKQLKSSNASIRFNAADILRGLGADAEPALSALAEGLQDEDKQVRAQCAFALSDIGYSLKERAQIVVLPLANALKDEDEEVRVLSSEALLAIGKAAVQVIPALKEAFNNQGESITVRTKCALH